MPAMLAVWLLPRNGGPTGGKSAKRIGGYMAGKQARDRDTVRIAAVGDIHYGKGSAGELRPLFEQVAERADVLILCGDLTDYGLPEEAELVVRDIAPAAHVPTVAVLGNHDYESGRQDEIREVLQAVGIAVLDGESCELLGIGFAGAKGFCGGFGRSALGYWGEPTIKAFVQEALDEALKLESALARLRTPRRVAILHYAPIEATVEGEPPTIFPYLGSSRLEEPLNRYPVDFVVHGHAHKGSPEGMTSAGVPVYNVSRGLLEATYPRRPAFREIVVDVSAPAEAAAD